MISRIDHVSIAVRDHEKAVHFFRDILGAIEGTGGPDHTLKYFWQIFSLGDLSRLEIISPTDKGSFLDGFLNRKAAGVHHLTLQVPDLRKTIEHLKEHSIPFFGHNEYPGNIWKEIFIHPRHAFGVLLQIAEFRADDWISESVKFPAGKKWELARTDNGVRVTFAHPGGGKFSTELERADIKQLIDGLEKMLE
jgi:methylmalonyl-CoA/ethylmalonyl-CoA epimerase